MRIFLVENHADTRKYMTLYLQSLGHAVQSADSMAEALNTVPRSNCDMLICDVGLPDGDGWQLMTNLQLERPLYAIAVSGFGSDADIERSRAAGFRHHVVKPFGADELWPYLDEAAREAKPKA